MVPLPAVRLHLKKLGLKYLNDDCVSSAHQTYRMASMISNMSFDVI